MINKYPIYDGVDTNLFKFKGYDDDIYSKKILNIGWVGNSNPNVHGINKGFNIIKETINSMDNKFIFIPQDIYICKQLSHEEMPEYYKNIDIIICFSCQEGTPNQILEASSCGKCWISTDVGIVGNLINNNYNLKVGIIIDRTVESLKNNLIYLYNNRNIIKEYGMNGRKLMELEWNWEKQSQQYSSFFEKI